MGIADSALARLAGDYLEDQGMDLVRFVVFYIALRGLPNVDALDDIAKLAVGYVSQHGTATPETVAAYLAEHTARPE